MKKTYINPNICVYEIKVNHQLLAGSETVSTQGDYNSGTITIASREVDFDDEDF